MATSSRSALRAAPRDRSPCHGDVTGARPASIGLTMLVSFCLSFGVMWWRAHTIHEPARAKTVAVDPAMNEHVGDGSGATPREGAAPRAPAETPESPQSSTPRVAVADPETIVTPPSNYDGPELPVMFNVVMNSIHKQSYDAAGEVRYEVVDAYEGIIYNTSERDLPVTATEVNIATQETWQTEFLLPKGTQKHFSVNDGLKMAAGDQLTLRSPAFRDSVRQIP